MKFFSTLSIRNKLLIVILPIILLLLVKEHERFIGMELLELEWIYGCMRIWLRCGDEMEDGHGNEKPLMGIRGLCIEGPKRNNY